MSDAIAVDRLIKRYPSMDRNAVDGVSFAIPGGAIVGLLGPNGAGKTTLTKLLCGASIPTSGVVRVCGEPLEGSGQRVKYSIGVVHQSAPFDMMLSALDNIRIAAAFKGLRWRDVRSQVSELVDVLGLAGRTGALTFTLSGGEQRRLQVVRAMLGQPRLLLLDEPSAGLDVAGRRHVWELIEATRVKHGTTIMWTSHYIEELERNCDQVMIMGNGKLVDFATPSELTCRFGGEIARVSLIDAEDGERVRVLADSCGLAVRVSGMHVELAGSDVRARTPLVLGVLQERGVAIGAVEFRPPSLEDAFLKLTETAR